MDGFSRIERPAPAQYAGGAASRAMRAPMRASWTGAEPS
jgi:hypothetical protein